MNNLKYLNIVFVFILLIILLKSFLALNDNTLRIYGFACLFFILVISIIIYIILNKYVSYVLISILLLLFIILFIFSLVKFNEYEKYFSII